MESPFFGRMEGNKNKPLAPLSVRKKTGLLRHALVFPQIVVMEAYTPIHGFLFFRVALRVSKGGHLAKRAEQKVCEEWLRSGPKLRLALNRFCEARSGFCASQASSQAQTPFLFAVVAASAAVVLVVCREDDQSASMTGKILLSHCLLLTCSTTTTTINLHMF